MSFEPVSLIYLCCMHAWTQVESRWRASVLYLSDCCNSHHKNSQPNASSKLLDSDIQELHPTRRQQLFLQWSVSRSSPSPQSDANPSSFHRQRQKGKISLQANCSQALVPDGQSRDVWFSHSTREPWGLFGHMLSPWWRCGNAQVVLWFGWWCWRRGWRNARL